MCREMTEGCSGEDSPGWGVGGQVRGGGHWRREGVREGGVQMLQRDGEGPFIPWFRLWTLFLRTHGWT